jgi:hypothetical protein
LQYVYSYHVKALRNVLFLGVPNSKDRQLTFLLGAFPAVRSYIASNILILKLMAVMSSQTAEGFFKKLAAYSVKILMVGLWLWYHMDVEISTDVLEEHAAPTFSPVAVCFF